VNLDNTKQNAWTDEWTSVQHVSNEKHLVPNQDEIKGESVTLPFTYLQEWIQILTPSDNRQHTNKQVILCSCMIHCACVHLFIVSLLLYAARRSYSHIIKMYKTPPLPSLPPSQASSSSSSSPPPPPPPLCYEEGEHF